MHCRFDGLVCGPILTKTDRVVSRWVDKQSPTADVVVCKIKHIQGRKGHRSRAYYLGRQQVEGSGERHGMGG
jgi:hypothetical protein